MTARVLKNRLRELMRQVRSPDENETQYVIANFLHDLLHNPQFWKKPQFPDQFDVKSVLRERFPSCLYSDEVP